MIEIKRMAYFFTMLLGAQQGLFGAVTDAQKRLISFVRSDNQEEVRKLGATLPSLNFGMPRIGSPLFWAIYENNEEMVYLLIELGADPNYCDRDPLLGFAYKNKNIVRILLEAGADPNAYWLIESSLYMAADWGSQHNDIEVFDMLLEAGGDLNWRSPVDMWGCPLLIRACKNKRADIVRLLLERGAEIDKMNFENQTALMAAGTDDIREILIDRGAEYDDESKLFARSRRTKMAARYHNRGQVIQNVLEDMRGLPRDLSRLVCLFAAVPKGQMPRHPQYNAYKVGRAC